MVQWRSLPQQVSRRNFLGRLRRRLLLPQVGVPHDPTNRVKPHEAPPSPSLSFIYPYEDSVKAQHGNPADVHFKRGRFNSWKSTTLDKTGEKNNKKTTDACSLHFAFTECFIELSETTMYSYLHCLPTH